MMQRFLVLALVASASGAISCGETLPLVGQAPDPRDTTVRQVVVTPVAVGLTPGGQVQLGVSIDAGAGVTNRTVTWTSSDTTIASVSQTGLVTGLMTSRTAVDGVVIITAASNFKPTVTGAARITVAAATPSPVRASK